MKIIHVVSTLFVLSILCACQPTTEAHPPGQAAQSERQALPSYSPASWAAAELEEYTRRNAVFATPYPHMGSRVAMIAANSEVLAVHVGKIVLDQGGSALDAALATAFGQVVLQAGAGVSFAGQMTLLYYEASGGKVHGLDGSFDTVSGETDPWSIPPVSTPSGRSVLVPGMLGGFAAAHRRFGRLPWADLIEPAIHLAQTGFEVNARLAGILSSRADALRRFPVMNRYLLKADGSPLGEGDLLMQVDLAATLEQIAARGAEHMYRGSWAANFVSAVQGQGGKISLDDLADWEAVWAEPLQSDFRHYQLFAPGPPSFGGASTLEAMNLLEMADFRGAHYLESAESLTDLVHIMRVAELLGPPMAGAPVPEAVLAGHFSGADLSAKSRSSKPHAAQVWRKMHQPSWAEFVQQADAGRAEGAEKIRQLLEIGWGQTPPEPPKPEHTSGIVAIDEQGNVVALMHSINSSYFGTGIRVGGITIPDTAAYQQALIASIGPGAKLPEPDNPVIALRDGKPVLASSGHGAGIHEVAVMGLLNILEFGMAPDLAVNAPTFGKDLVPGQPLRLLAGPGGFPLETLQAALAAGAPLEIVTEAGAASQPGFAVMMTIDGGAGAIRAGITTGVNGGGEGY